MALKSFQSISQILRKDYDLLGDIEIPLAPDESEEPVQDGSAKFAHALWQSISKGSIDFLELFSGSARLSQAAALTGLRVGSPVDLRTGFDLNTRSGQRKAMQIILDQEPEIIHMAPKCSAWCMWSTAKGEHQCYDDRQRALPMVRFCAQVALHQIKHGRQLLLKLLRVLPYGVFTVFKNSFARSLLPGAISTSVPMVCVIRSQNTISANPLVSYTISQKVF